MNSFNDDGNAIFYEDNRTIDFSFLSRTFLWMALGLLVTGAVAWYSYQSNLVYDINLSLIALIELVVVIVFSFCFNKLSSTVVSTLFIGYAVLNGLTFSTLFYVFELDSVVSIFAVAAFTFGLLGYIGSTTQKDLSKWHSVFIAFLVGSLVISLFNLIFKVPVIHTVIDVVVLGLFFGITIYDINKIKRYGNYDIAEPEKIYVYCAMEIYLDFINIFIRLLYLFGRRKN